MPKDEKIQKVLARLGLGSRRTIETWIKAGRITVNGKIAKIGDRISLVGKIAVDGKPIKQKLLAKPIQCRVLLYFKPEGEVCTRFDEKGRPTVFRSLPKLAAGRWISIGRLDINSSGLLLFTNDGELANKLMHPSTEIEREYAVRVYGDIDEQILKELKQGVMLSDGLAKFKSIKKGGESGANRWFYVVVTEGRNRLVRRLWEAKHIAVNRLIRIRFGKLKLPQELRPGEYIELKRFAKLL